MTWLLILGGAMLLLGLALLPGGKPTARPPAYRRRDPGGSGVWIDDHGPSGGLQLDKFGYPVDAVGLISEDDSGFDPGGGSGGGGGASGGWDDAGSDGGGDGGGGSD